MQLDDYIGNTRKVIGSKSDELFEYYTRIFEMIRQFIPYETDDLNFEVIYTSNKTAEVVELGSARYLLYDQYLGQVFNHLNFLFFEATLPKEAIGYCFKLFAEEFQISGDLTKATILAYSYLKEYHCPSPAQQDVNRAKRNNYTYIQEVFVLAHELIHHNLPEPTYLSAIRQNSIDIFIRGFKREDYIRNKGFELFLQDQAKATGDFDPEREIVKDEEYFKLQEEYVQDFRSALLQNIELVNSSDDLLEEICCDEIATLVVMLIMAEKHNFPVAMVLDAIYVGLMNLRLLGIIHQQVWSISSGGGASSSILQNGLVRLQLFRDNATYKYWTTRSGEDLTMEIHDQFNATNSRYAELISDPVIFDLCERIKGLENDQENTDFDTFLVRNELIDMALSHTAD